MDITANMTEEDRNAMWQQAGSRAFGYMQGAVSAVATPVVESVDAVAGKLNDINHATPSIVPGHPTTDFIGDPLNKPMERMGNAITDFFSDLRDKATDIATDIVVLNKLGETPDEMIGKM